MVGLLPVRVILRDYAARGLNRLEGVQSLWQFIVDELACEKVGGHSLAPFTPILEQILTDKGGILLLDGLDEVPDANLWREQLREQIHDLVRKFPEARVLVTSRPYAYDRPEWKLRDFTQLTLLDFSDWQIRYCVTQRYGYLGQHGNTDYGVTQAERDSHDLIDQIMARPHLLELARRPLLLSLIISLHHWSGRGTLPINREELYHQAVDLLLERWQKRKAIEVVDQEGSGELTSLLGIERDQLRQVLSKIAYAVHREQPRLRGTADIRAGQLAMALYEAMDQRARKEIGQERIINYIRDRAGLLEEWSSQVRNKEVYRLVHRTFQEYLAGCYLLEQDDEDFAELAAKLGRLDPERWRESLLLAGLRGRDADAWDLVTELVDKQLPDSNSVIKNESWWGAFLAGQLVFEKQLHHNTPQRRRAQLELLINWLALLIEKGALPVGDRAEAGNMLAIWGDPRQGVCTLEPSLCELIPAGSQILRSNHQTQILRIISDCPLSGHCRSISAFHRSKWLQEQTI